MTSLTFSINKRWTPRTPLALRVHIISHKFDVILCCRSASEERILKRKQNSSKKLPLLKIHGQCFCDRDCDMSTGKELENIVSLSYTLRACCIKDMGRGYKMKIFNTLHMTNEFKFHLGKKINPRFTKIFTFLWGQVGVFMDIRQFATGPGRYRDFKCRMMISGSFCGFRTTSPWQFWEGNEKDWGNEPRREGNSSQRKDKSKGQL